jgi:hypothetical protein
VYDVTTVLLSALVALLAVGEFLLFGALAEAYRDIRQLREYAGIIDRAAPVDLGEVRGAPASSVGLHPDLDSAVQSTVVFLENRCGTCRAIVGSLHGAVPEGIWLVLVAESAGQAYDWLATGGVDRGSPDARRVMVVSPDDVERQLGLLVTPLVVEVEHGRLARAKTIGSVRQFYDLAPPALTLAPTVEKGAAP